MKKLSLKANWPFLTINSMIFVAVMYLIFLQFKAEDRIVYVDSIKLLSEYKGAQDAKKAFEGKANVWKSTLDTLTGEVQADIRNYERNVVKMDARQQEEARRLINIKRKQMVEYQRAVQENATQENGKTMEPIIIKVNKFLLEYGKTHNYKMILIANQSGTIAFAKEGLDITPKVIEELNKNYIAVAR